MGTGTITLWWYALCCAFVTLSVIATSVLVALGQRKRRAKKSAADPGDRGEKPKSLASEGDNRD